MTKISKTNIDGIYMFFCQGCNNCHWFSTSGRSLSNPDKITGPKWQFNNNFEKPTIRASILVRLANNKVCHSFITDGKIQFLNDCSHKLAGKTVELENFDD